MNVKIEPTVVLDELEPLSQKLKLRCCRCSKRAIYDVGRVFCHKESEDPSAKYHYTFSNYFRCRSCDSAGPWEIADFLTMMGLAMRAGFDRRYDGLAEGACALFDGTLIQSPAMGEVHLLNLIEKDPRNAFLHTRLGNLLRNCNQKPKAADWYRKALEFDSGDVEARYHLFIFAIEAGDVPAALVHAPLLVRYFLEGRGTGKDELTEGMALSVIDKLRDAPEPFRMHFLNRSRESFARPEDTFIHAVLSQEGDDREIADDAAQCLLRGELYGQNIDSAEPFIELFPSLRKLVETEGLEAENLSVIPRIDDPGKILVKDRHSMVLSDGRKVVHWQAPPLREMLRGNRPAPPDMKYYPGQYDAYFFLIENHILSACGPKRDFTDQELGEVYSALRRRPDGVSHGPLHDFVWQAAALLAGSYVLSAAQFEAIFGQLARSTRTWAIKPISRNYMAYLRRTFKKMP